MFLRKSIHPKAACAKCAAVIGTASVVSFLIAVIIHVIIRFRGELESDGVARIIVTAQACGVAGLVVSNFLWFQIRYNEDPEDIRMADLVTKRLRTWFCTGGPADLVAMLLTLTQLLNSAASLEKLDEADPEDEGKVRLSGGILSGVCSVVRLPTMICLILGRQRKSPQRRGPEEEEPHDREFQYPTSQRSALVQEDRSQRTSQAQDRSWLDLSQRTSEAQDRSSFDLSQRSSPVQDLSWLDLSRRTSQDQVRSSLDLSQRTSQDIDRSSQRMGQAQDLSWLDLSQRTSQDQDRSSLDLSQRTNQDQDPSLLRSSQGSIVLKVQPVGVAVGLPIVVHAPVALAQVVGSPQGDTGGT
eukprot:TRINITY_DN7334_c0_g1_i1.p1 TRINITY_DN7334_c0_g1~~TRINITY_DN7334_c0_g1_i1.p1  ORF type:complete len:356 (-),score=28.80 TRINITY_DN7334_c0_g1_i1:285-1352(-)